MPSRSARLYRIINNTPRLLYDGSRFLDGNLDDERITREDFLVKVRQSGPPSPAEPNESIMGPVTRG